MYPGSAKFAPYEPERRRRGSMDFVVRSARPSDVPEIADITLEREGGNLVDHLNGATGEIERLAAGEKPGLLVVAESEGKIAGYARVVHRNAPEGAASEDVPEGWYLGGVIVSPDFRRYGIGLRLTEHRIAWVARRADVVRYFASLQNRASIALHEKLGFREVRRGIMHPDLQFTGGVGALYELLLREPS